MFCFVLILAGRCELCDPYVDFFGLVMDLQVNFIMIYYYYSLVQRWHTELLSKPDLFFKFHFIFGLDSNDHFIFMHDLTPACHYWNMNICVWCFSVFCLCYHSIHALLTLFLMSNITINYYHRAAVFKLVSR